ncbi:hypothetical protein [Pseudonocardia oroxyli]|uniref:SnoaL-like domain-containing protein n=1 Tax=Pseudonocardia oroxyli TaxID=366584 RepID=A0A1G7SYH1_PSEOR|nr:hypothetical protein [Pseudonocardia oroxyli]SDG27824.1 hypothetical protein SAMN05216377_110133 [Pseudonocardia oroxyli]
MIDAGEDVVIDVVARYDGPDGSAIVASCDLYRFAAATITAITSYTVELPPTQADT